MYICEGIYVGAWGSVLLRRCSTSRKVPGSTPGGVTGFFSDTFPSERTMVLGSSQALVKMSTRNIPKVMAAGVYGLQPTTILCRCQEI